MLVEEGRTSETLKRIVGGCTNDRGLQQDILQELLLKLWRVECDEPGRSRSWYLQNCRFHALHCLTAGRSLDSTKRARGGKRITFDEMDLESVLPDYQTGSEVVATVSARDIVSTLARHLKPA